MEVVNERKKTLEIELIRKNCSETPIDVNVDKSLKYSQDLSYTIGLYRVFLKKSFLGYKVWISMSTTRSNFLRNAVLIWTLMSMDNV